MNKHSPARRDRYCANIVLYRNEWRKFWLLAALLLPLVAPAAEPSPLAGGWAGKIGDRSIHACFSPATSVAHYFYLARLEPIQLLVPDAPAPPGVYQVDERVRQGVEDQATGKWEINLTDGGSLRGQWTHPKTGQQLPIRLQRIETKECGDAYYSPLYKRRVAKLTTEKFEGKEYTVATHEDGKAFVPPPSLQNAERIDAFAQNWLKAQVRAAFDCRIDGGRGEWDKSLKPVFWSSRWLVLEDSLPETFCGGAHGFYTVDYLTFDLQTGLQVDTWKWVANAARVKDSENGKAKPALRRLIERDNDRAECRELNPFMSVRSPYLSPNGLVFPTSFIHAMRSCDDAAVIKLKDVEKYLTPAGVVAVRDAVP